MNQKKERSKIWPVLFFVFLSIVILAACAVFMQYRNYCEADRRFESLQSYAYENTVEAAEENFEEKQNPEREENNTQAETENDTSKKDEDVAVTEYPGIEVPDKNLDWDMLHKENEDIYAWIYVPDTTVDYPVLQHPTDNGYYLDHNMDGTRGYPGCIYTEDFNSKDFSDIHTVIYGHNLKDQTMFSSLHNFEDKELFDEDHYIFVYTEDYVFVYRIFAAYEFNSIHLLDNYDYTNEYVYEDYLKKIYRTTDRVANVKADIPVTTADRIITLSTCTADHDSDRRFLVTGVLINPREQEM